MSLTTPSGQSWGKAAVVLSKVQDQVCLALVPHLTTFHTNTTMSCAMICHCNNKIKYNTNTSIGKPGYRLYMHSHQQMMWVNSALQVCWVSALCHHLNSNDLAHIYREAAAGDQTHATCHRATGSRAVRHKFPVCFAYLDVGECLSRMLHELSKIQHAWVWPHQVARAGVKQRLYCQKFKIKYVSR